MRFFNRLALAGFCIALPALSAAAQAQSPGLAGEQTIETLKGIYLDCDRVAASGGLDDNQVMRCSVVYEELKRRAFDNDFRRLKAWSDVALAASGLRP